MERIAPANGRLVDRFGDASAVRVAIAPPRLTEDAAGPGAPMGEVWLGIDSGPLDLRTLARICDAVLAAACRPRASPDGMLTARAPSRGSHCSTLIDRSTVGGLTTPNP